MNDHQGVAGESTNKDGKDLANAGGEVHSETEQTVDLVGECGRPNENKPSILPFVTKIIFGAVPKFVPRSNLERPFDVLMIGGQFESEGLERSNASFPLRCRVLHFHVDVVQHHRFQGPFSIGIIPDGGAER